MARERQELLRMQEANARNIEERREKLKEITKAWYQRLNQAVIRIQRWIRRFIRRKKYFELVARRRDILRAQLNQRLNDMQQTIKQVFEHYISLETKETTSLVKDEDENFKLVLKTPNS